MTKQDIDRTWEGLVALSAEALRMDETEKAKFAANDVAKLVGLLPYLAECEERERTALAHLATWVVANRGGARKVFDHKAADDRDPLARLAPIGHFRGGDPAVIEAGMKRLALCMVAGYKRDMEKDAKSGEYNPLNARTWNYEAIAAKLQEPSGGLKLLARAAPAGGSDIDLVMDAESAVRNFWGA